MAIRQYIGARYVPRFMGTFDPSQVYEVLDVVDNGLGTSYILKNPAPAGTPVTNTTYWAIYGASSGAIINLQNQIDDMNDGDVPGSLQNQINQLDTELVGEYALWFGDSFVQASSLGADIDKRYSTLMSSMLGLTEKNYAAGGTGFIVSTPTNYEQVQNAIIDFTSNNLDVNKVKYAFIGGFKNDGPQAFSDKWTYESAIIDCINLIKNNFPNAQIVIIPTASAFYLEENLLTNLNFMEEAVSRVSDKVILLKDAYKWLSGQFNDILYQNNANVHPSVSGHQKLASKLYSELFGCQLPITSYVNVDPQTWQTGIDAANSVWTISKADGMAHVFIKFKVGAADIPLTSSNPNIARRDNSALYTADPYFIGRQTYVQRLEGRYITDLQYLPMGKVSCQVNKTGDTAGTLALIFDGYAGTLKANETYKMDFYISDNIRRLSADLA